MASISGSQGIYEGPGDAVFDEEAMELTITTEDGTEFSTKDSHLVLFYVVNQDEEFTYKGNGFGDITWLSYDDEEGETHKEIDQ